MIQSLLHLIQCVFRSIPAPRPSFTSASYHQAFHQKLWLHCWHCHLQVENKPEIRDATTLLRSHRIHVWHIYLHLVDFYGINVGKYASPMDSGWGWDANKYHLKKPVKMVKCLELVHKEVRVADIGNGRSTWRIIPVSKWLITMVSKSHK